MIFEIPESKEIELISSAKRNAFLRFKINELNKDGKKYHFFISCVESN